MLQDLVCASRSSSEMLASVQMTPFRQPVVRSARVIARVSTSAMPSTPCTRGKVSTRFGLLTSRQLLCSVLLTLLLQLLAASVPADYRKVRVHAASAERWSQRVASPTWSLLLPLTLASLLCRHTMRHCQHSAVITSGCPPAL